MQPFLFEPVLPFVCLAMALLAPLVALGLHRAAPRHARAWSTVDVIAHTLRGLTALVGGLLFGLVLEYCAGDALMRTGHGVGLHEPLTWLGMVTHGASKASRLVWQVGLLTGPTLYALHRIGGRRLPRRGRRMGPALLLAPIAAWVAIQISPPSHGAAALLALMLVVFAGALTLAWPSARPVAPEPAPSPSLVSQPIEVRAQPAEDPEPITRVTRLPAALAASLKTLQTAPDQALTRPVPGPVRAPVRLPESAQRRARRSRRTL